MLQLPTTFALTPNNPQFMDLTGLRFGKLVVVGYGGSAGGHKYWFCRCDCGTIIDSATTNKLRSGSTKSCGCSRSDRSTRHGFAKGGKRRAPEYTAYHHMIGRCCNPKNSAYADYGGRGIKVCERWRDSFKNFLADMGLRPSPLHSLDRKDSDGQYEPGNCRWATKKQQARNRRSNRYVIANGKRMSLPDACEALGVPYKLTLDRMKDGWTFERATQRGWQC